MYDSVRMRGRTSPQEMLSHGFSKSERFVWPLDGGGLSDLSLGRVGNWCSVQLNIWHVRVAKAIFVA